MMNTEIKMIAHGIENMLTCPCDVDPLTPHFHIVNLGLTRVYIIFLLQLLNIDCGYYVLSKNKKIIKKISAENCHFYIDKKLQYIAYACLLMKIMLSANLTYDITITQTKFSKL